MVSLFAAISTLFAVVAPAFAEPAASVGFATDPRFFSETGFRIDDDRFWDYFVKRGGINNFGYPVSRPFQFMGRRVQFFQRRILQINADGSVGQLNILDSTL